MKVFIDLGHGGKDPGAVGNGLKEKDVVLPIGLKVGDILKKHGVDVSYSRTTDVYLELADRATKANSLGVKLFVSIHCNSFSNSSSKGVETYSYPNSQSGAKLSKDIQNSIIASKVYTANRGTKTANFAVLRLTNMPASLVELAFISNTEDANILRSKQNELAIAVAKGILNNLGIPYKESPEGLYRVQVGAFSVRANANSLVNELKINRYSPIVVQVDGLYKVQVGAFNVKTNADGLINELKNKGYQAIVVS